VRPSPLLGSIAAAEKTARRFLGAICIAVLCGILVAGLWPFHSPRNGVTWLAGEDGLRFAYPGTVVSEGEFHVADALESSCSIEVWVQPALVHDSSTLLAFHTARNPVQLALRQSLTDLEVRRSVAHNPDGRGTEHFYVDAFRSPRPVFLTISSGARGTAAYIDGVLVRAAPRFRIPAGDCTGRLVVATSPVEDNAWTGRLRGLAIYHGELTAAQAARHYQTWTGKGRPEPTAEERCVALYLFDERAGNLIHNRIPAVPALLIPERYRIEDQAFLMPFWEGFDLPDILENIAAFVPLGFLFCAWLSLRPSARRTALIVTVLGGLVSLTMEVLQAHLPTRHSDTTDIITDTFGTWVGVMLYRYVAAWGLLGKRKWRILTEPTGDAGQGGLKA